MPEAVGIMKQFEPYIKQKSNTRLQNLLAAEVEEDSLIESVPTFNVEGTAYCINPVMA